VPAEAHDLLAWLRELFADWTPQVRALIRIGDEGSLPIDTRSEEEFLEDLEEKGWLLPLPDESAALSNLFETEILDIVHRALEDEDVTIRKGGSRSYPDFEFDGSFFRGGPHAVDVKCARHTGASVDSTIALYTGNTYFLFPDLPFPGMLRTFGEYDERIAIVVLYRYRPDLLERFSDVSVAIQPSWRIAGTTKPSSTRHYIGSVNRVADIVNGQGAFDTEQEFYDYWRSAQRGWPVNPGVAKARRKLAAARKAAARRP
jgi:hypothetical protein